MTPQTKITFDKGSRNWVLGLFDKSTDNENFIIEKSDNSRINTPEGREITIDQLAIIKKGSEKFYAGDLTSLMKFTKGEI